ncbi:MAG: DoxX family protein [Bacteroidales bacterium]|jgi:putative oxidoreductase|nr:DoxX family protein [Bacteroidales bacterium]
MKIIESYNKISESISRLKSMILLMLRLVLAYGFYETARMKWGNISGVADWFQSMNYPFPVANAYLAASTEALGVVLLFLGLGTRLISLPLMFVMVIAILTVHISHGFEAGRNGFEIPLYYLLMLFTLLVYGSGKISIDHLIKRRVK